LVKLKKQATVPAGGFAGEESRRYRLYELAFISRCHILL